MELSEKQCDFIKEVIIEMDNIEIRTDYIGRCQNKECFGIVLDQHDDPFSIGICLGSRLIEEAKNQEIEEEVDIDILLLALQASRVDSMGLGTIIYFPRLQWNDKVDIG